MTLAMPLPDTLTDRELDVYELVGAGLTSKEIADRLGIADQTVKNHIAAVAVKLGVVNRIEALLRLGWLVVPSRRVTWHRRLLLRLAALRLWWRLRP